MKSESVLNFGRVSLNIFDHSYPLARFISPISIKISTQQNLDAKVSILKISTKKKKTISTVEKISTLEKSQSRSEGRSQSRSRLVSTVETTMPSKSSSGIPWNRHPRRASVNNFKCRSFCNISKNYLKMSSMKIKD